MISLAVVPLPIETENVTATALGSYAQGGVFIPVKDYLGIYRALLLQLGAWVRPPANQTLTLALAIERKDHASPQELAGTRVGAVSGATAEWTQAFTPIVDVTRPLQGEVVVALRLLAAVNGGTGKVQIPTLLLFGVR